MNSVKGNVCQAPLVLLRTECRYDLARRRTRRSSSVDYRHPVCGQVPVQGRDRERCFRFMSHMLMFRAACVSVCFASHIHTDVRRYALPDSSVVPRKGRDPRDLRNGFTRPSTGKMHSLPSQDSAERIRARIPCRSRGARTCYVCAALHRFQRAVAAGTVPRAQRGRGALHGAGLRFFTQGHGSLSNPPSLDDRL